MGHHIGKLLTGYKIIVDKSTVPVGTAEKVQALVHSARQVDYEFQIFNAVMEVNERQKVHLAGKIREFCEQDLRGKHFALWGLALSTAYKGISEAGHSK